MDDDEKMLHELLEALNQDVNEALNAIFENDPLIFTSVDILRDALEAATAEHGVIFPSDQARADFIKDVVRRIKR